jgi:predicted N-acetyltransferase YhbS/L-amino acid N-acyltransferase YncA
MIVRAAEREECPEICDLVDKAFKGSTIERTMIDVTTGVDPNFQKGDLRVAEADGRIASMMMLIRRPLRIGTAIVNGAMVGPVATHPNFQGKGYCSAVMRDAVRYMERQGFDITLLWGIPWLYTRYGYSPAMVKTEAVIELERKTPSENRSYHRKSFTEADLEQMTHIYHSNTATRTCAEIRSLEMWEWRPGGSEAKLEVLTDKKGEVIAYHALGTDWSGSPCAHEIGVLDNKACDAILDSLVRTAKKRGLKEFHCVVHPSHPFARFAFGHNGEIRIKSGGGSGMTRVISLVSLFSKMEKEFERRLSYSEFHNRRCTVKLSSEGKSVVLDIDRGHVTTSADDIKGDYQLDISLAYLNPLITGCKGIAELTKSPQVKVKGGKTALRLIDVLFPTGFPSGGHPPLVWE